ncbi:MAG: maleylpyruvate isomerase family mycothiol-dependent enzyme, partial [Candidatus Tectomicrobia bacterium]|nr:maleylpyruvate isomerase family mycothiol-dependent enzyme [Candidatus Tectomicrobia bacterium]
MVTICADLQAELAALDAIVSPLDESGWNTQTPAAGWLVRDQIAHIGGTDRIATIAAGEPKRFQNDILTQDRSARAARQHQEIEHLSGAELVNWWRSGRKAMLQVFLPLDPKARIPWFGPAMSAVSFAT